MLPTQSDATPGSITHGLLRRLTATTRAVVNSSLAILKLFAQREGETIWRQVPEDASGRARLPLLDWQMPELLMLAVAEGDTSSPTLPPAGYGTASSGGVAVPVVPEVC